MDRKSAQKSDVINFIDFTDAGSKNEASQARGPL